MVFPVVGGNESKGYEISNSLRFNDGDSPELYKTLGSPTNNKIYTFSMWLKRSDVTATTTFIGHYDGSASNPFVTVQFRSDGALRVEAYDNDTTSVMSLRTNQLFRDPSAWYHIVLAFDTTQGTAANRVKVYVNGNQVTSFQSSYETYPDQDKVLAFNKENTEAYYGVYKYGNSGSGGNFYDGYITELHFIDGQQKAQTDFGEFDDNGVWIPKKYTGTYGNNGHFFEFKQTGTSANSSGIGADTSGNDNHFAVTNFAATDITEDTCTNNFCTMNPLAIGADATLSEGNCQIAYGSGTRSVSTATMGFASGKWYWEWKISAASTDGCSAMPGIGGLPFGPDLGTYLGNNSNGYAYNGEDGKKYSGGANSAYGDTFTTNDIISVAFDADNGNLYFYKNGTIQNSGTAAYTSLTSPSSGFYYPAMGDASGAKTFTAQANFGNPPYSISSGNTDGKYGNFEYAPPSGYYALCTKRLAEFG